MQQEKDMDVVPSGEALSLAAKLLGVRSFKDVIASEGPGEVREEFRPPLLGLGADPKKQGKALTAAMNVERKLAQHIKGSSAAGMILSVKDGLQGRASQPDSSESQPEEEELGRAGAILKKSQPVAQHWSKTVESSIAKKKKKKRQKLSTGQ